MPPLIILGGAALVAWLAWRSLSGGGSGGSNGGTPEPRTVSTDPVDASGNAASKTSVGLLNEVEENGKGGVKRWGKLTTAGGSIGAVGGPLGVFFGLAAGSTVGVLAEIFDPTKNFTDYDWSPFAMPGIRNGSIVTKNAAGEPGEWMRVTLPSESHYVTQFEWDVKSVVESLFFGERAAFDSAVAAGALGWHPNRANPFDSLFRAVAPYLYDESWLACLFVRSDKQEWEQALTDYQPADEAQVSRLLRHLRAVTYQTVSNGYLPESNESNLANAVLRCPQPQGIAVISMLFEYCNAPGNVPKEWDEQLFKAIRTVRNGDLYGAASTKEKIGIWLQSPVQGLLGATGRQTDDGVLSIRGAPKLGKIKVYSGYDNASPNYAGFGEYWRPAGAVTPGQPFAFECIIPARESYESDFYRPAKVVQIGSQVFAGKAGMNSHGAVLDALRAGKLAWSPSLPASIAAIWEKQAPWLWRAKQDPRVGGGSNASVTPQPKEQKAPTLGEVSTPKAKAQSVKISKLVKG